MASAFTPAEPPRLPPHTRDSERAARDQEAAFRTRARLEARTIARGMLWLGVIVLVLSILHAGLGRAFVPGWWREW